MGSPMYRQMQSPSDATAWSGLDFPIHPNCSRTVYAYRTWTRWEFHFFSPAWLVPRTGMYVKLMPLDIIKWELAKLATYIAL